MKSQCLLLFQLSILKHENIKSQKTIMNKKKKANHQFQWTQCIILIILKLSGFGLMFAKQFFLHVK